MTQILFMDSSKFSKSIPTANLQLPLLMSDVSIAIFKESVLPCHPPVILQRFADVHINRLGKWSAATKNMNDFCT